MYYIYDKTNQWRCSVATLRWSNVVKISPLLLPYYPASSAGHHSYSASSNKHHVLSLRVSVSSNSAAAPAPELLPPEYNDLLDTRTTPSLLTSGEGMKAAACAHMHL